MHDGSTVGGTRLATLTGGLVPTTQLPAATTSVQGAVILNNTVTSTSATQALTAAQGKVLNDQAFGVGQTWQDFTGSRSSGVTYTNQTNRPISVSLSIQDSNSFSPISVTVGGVVIIDIDDHGSNGTIPLFFIVPPNSTYLVNRNQNIIRRWAELR